MDALTLFSGRKRLPQLFTFISEREPVYLEQLAKLGWNRKTALNILRLLEEHGLISDTVEYGGNKGTKRLYSLTPKGRRILQMLYDLGEALEAD